MCFDIYLESLSDLFFWVRKPFNIESFRMKTMPKQDLSLCSLKKNFLVCFFGEMLPTPTIVTHGSIQENHNIQSFKRKKLQVKTGLKRRLQVYKDSLQHSKDSKDREKQDSLSCPTALAHAASLSRCFQRPL